MKGIIFFVLAMSMSPLAQTIDSLVVEDNKSVEIKEVTTVTEVSSEEVVVTETTKKIDITRDSISAEIKTVVDSLKADSSFVQKIDSVTIEAVVVPKKVVVEEITAEEREALIKKSLKEKETQDAVQKRRIDNVVKIYLRDTEEYRKKLKGYLREEYQYKNDLDKIRNSTFLTKRIKDKKTAYTNNKLRKVLVYKDDLVDGLEKEAYKNFEFIVSKKLSFINSFEGTERIIEKMNLRLELMKTGQAILKTTKEELTGSYDIAIVDEIIEDMERNFVRKYEELITSIK